MKCRECGTEIAEKALICFRCGASVQEAVHKPYIAPKKKRPLHRVCDLRAARVDCDRAGDARSQILI